MIHRTTSRMGLLLLVAVAAAASASCGRDRTEGGQDVVRIAMRGSFTNAAFVLGEAEGDFAREGRRLEYVDSPAASVQAIPLLEREVLDIVAGAPNAGFYAAVAKGARSRLVADRGHVDTTACEFNGIVGRKNAFRNASPTAADLAGKKFSINSPGAAAFIIDKYLASFGLTESHVEVVRLPQVLEGQALASGSLDATYAAEPYMSAIMDEGHYLLARGTDLSPGAHIGSVMFGPSLTVTNRDLGMRVMRAYLRGARRFAEGMTPRNIEIIARTTGFDPKVLAKVCPPSISVNGTLDLEWLLEFQKWAVKRGYLDKVGGIDAGVDMAFAQAAVAHLAAAPATR